MKTVEFRSVTRVIGGSKGTPGTPPVGTNSFIFMQLSAKSLKNNPILVVGALPQDNPGSAIACVILAFQVFIQVLTPKGS